METDHRLQLTTHVEGDGTAFTARGAGAPARGRHGQAEGLEVPARPAFRPDWRKIKLMNTQDCVILGWTRGERGRAGTFGALLVGRARRRPLGVDRPGRHRLHGRDADATSWSSSGRWCATRPPIDDPQLAAVKGATFVEPEVVCEVSYLEITKSTKKMRAPSFKGLRPDKAPG